MLTESETIKLMNAFKGATQVTLTMSPNSGKVHEGSEERWKRVPIQSLPFIERLRSAGTFRRRWNR